LSELKEVEKVALNLLARREHSQAELKSKLRLRKFDETTIESVLAHLIKNDFQSDNRFTEIYVRMRSRLGYGPSRIAQELQQRGASNELINQYLTGDLDWVKMAAHVRQKRFGRLIPTGFKEQAKQKHFLHYRGFTTDQIKAVFNDDDDR